MVSKIIIIIIGLAFFVLGIWGIVSWWNYFIQVIMGAIPAFSILLGVILIIFGYSEFKSLLAERKEKKEETT